jgi:hypothetical protein
MPWVPGTGILSPFGLRPPLREWNPSLSIPELRYGFDAYENRLLILTWKDSPRLQSDLNFFWSEELRVHRRVTSRGDLHDCIAPMITSGSDAMGYHLIIALSGRRVLGELQKRSLYRPVYSATERSQRWRDIGRLARALMHIA